MRRWVILVFLAVHLTCHGAENQPSYALRVSDSGLCLDSVASGVSRPLVKSLSYQANFVGGPAFRTTGVKKRSQEDGVEHVELALDGPAAGDASVKVEVRRGRRHVQMVWTVHYTGPEKEFNKWTTGFRLEYAQPISDARALPMTQFVRPTGDKPYEVKGDAPYRDLDCQLREVFFGDMKLVIAT
jgi:hypothetical protein